MIVEVMSYLLGIIVANHQANTLLRSKCLTTWRHSKPLKNFVNDLSFDHTLTNIDEALKTLDGFKL